MSALKDFCDVEYGKALPEKIRIAGASKVFGSAGLVGTHKNSLYDEPLIVVGRKGNISGVHKVDGPSWVIDTAYAIRPRDGLQRDYLFYFLKFHAAYLASMDQSTAIPSLAREVLYSLPLVPPTASAQKKVVEKIEALFSEIDTGLEELNSAKANLDLYKQSVLNSAIRGNLVPQRSKDEPASEILERVRTQKQKIIKETKLRKDKLLPPVSPEDYPFELPKGWVWVRIVEIAESVPYAMAIGPFGSNLKVPDYRDEGVPLIFVRNIRTGIFGGGKAKYVTDKKAKELVAHSVSAGDVLVTKMGEPPGDACVYPIGSPDAIITADCIKIRVNDKLISANYLAHLINSPVVKPQIQQKTQGVAQKKVSLERFREILIPLPPREEQDRILINLERSLSAISSVTFEFSQRANLVSSLKQSILKSAFEGTLV